MRIGHGAEIDVEEAVEALEAIRQDRGRGQSIGHAGATLTAELNWPKQIAEMKRVLLPISPDGKAASRGQLQ